MRRCCLRSASVLVKMAAAPRTTHHRATTEGSVDPKGRGARAIVPNNKNDDMRLDRVELGVLSICDRSWSSSRGDQSERERHVNPEELRELSRDPKRPDRSGFNT